MLIGNEQSTLKSIC